MARLRFRFSSLRSVLRVLRGNERGAAAAEFALVLPIFIIPLLNAIDFGIYVYDRMELNDAAQVAAQAAWAQCAVKGFVPATVNGNCAALSSAETSAAHGTTLGTGVTITSTTENYYCLNSSGSLVIVGSFPTTEPSDCSSVNPGSTDVPGDYILVTASYTYTPFFSQVSAASLLTTPITQTAWMRLQ